MAKVSLRSYNSDIEKMIEGRQVQEAIAHCRHILKGFPKHIDTYRLLGKAFLEGQRYAEAVDILQRVLSVLPDDFISHLGMSIIREDENNLDAAIFHMERAFEIQPASPSIQGELRRLYGRRDGIEPPRIRLNRGALVRMYTRGELYPQAIAEAKAALQEDAQRTDLQVILARLYFLSGQKVQAVEIASQLVNKLPYCYEANRILAEVLPGSARAEEAKVFRQRLEALDPYTALITPAAPISADVADIAVQVDRLEYDAAADVSGAPEWAQAAGATWDNSSTETTPAWLNAANKSESIQAAAIETQPEEITPSTQADIPDWMASAGWSPATSVEEPVNLLTSDDDDEQSDLAAAVAELPDWLQSLAPAPQSSEGKTREDVEEDQEWSAMLSAGPQSISLSTTDEQPETLIPDDLGSPAEIKASWLDELPVDVTDENILIAEEQVSQTDLAGGDALPDWIQELAAAQSTEAAEDDLIPEELVTNPEMPAWLQGTADQATAGSIVAESSELEQGVELPDWLQSLSTDQVADQTVLETEAVPEEISTMEAALNEVEIAEPREEIPVVTDLPTTASLSSEITPLAQPEDDMEAALAWLEALAAKQGADEATLVTSPDERNETMPEWLAQSGDIDSESVLTTIESHETVSENFEAEKALENESVEFMAESDKVVVAEEQDLTMISADLPTLTVLSTDELAEAGITDQLSNDATAETGEGKTEILESNDMDAAMAWLENLAAQHGADEETLFVKPEDRTDTPPEWVSRTDAIQAEAAADQPVAETTEQSAWSELDDELTPLAQAEQVTSETQEEFDAISAHTGEISFEGAQVLASLGKTDQKEIPEERVDDLTPAELGSMVSTSFEDNEPGESLPTNDELPQDAESLATLFDDEEETLEFEGITADDTAAKTQPVRITTSELVGETNLQEVADLSKPVEMIPPPEETIQEGRIQPEMQVQEATAEEEDETKLPDWLSGLEEEPAEISQADAQIETEIPQWLRDVDVPAAPGEQPVSGIIPPEWIYEEPTATPPAVPEEIAILETEAEVSLAPEDRQAEIQISAAPQEPEETPPPQPETTGQAERGLLAAQQALQKGNIERAIEEYNAMIQAGENLEETIHDLRDATYRFPVDTSVWQALGDAYLRSNRVQDALDAYTKAEELLR